MSPRERVAAAWGRLVGKRPVRTPTVIQTDTLGCGAATIAIVLGHFGRFIPIEQLRSECGVSRDGVSALDLLQVARSHGLQAKAFKLEPEALDKLPWPCVLHWQLGHFVVFEGFLRGGRARINDPAEGRKVLSREELDECMTGVVVGLVPEDHFEPLGSPPSLWPALRRQLRGSGPALGIIGLLSLLLALPALLLPALSKVFVDQVLIARQDVWMSVVAGGLALAALLGAGLTWIQRRRLVEVETELLVDRSGHFLWHLLSLPLEVVHQRYVGDLVSRVGLHKRLTELMTRELAIHVSSSVLLLFFVGAMAWIDLQLTLVTLLLLSLNGAVLAWMGRRRAEGHTRLTFERSKLNGTAYWGLEMIESLKATASEGDLFSRWAGHQARVVNVQHRLDREQQMLQVAPPFLTALNAAFLLGLGGLRVLQGEMTLGSLIAFQLLAAAFAVPVARLVALGGNLQLARGELQLVDDVLSAPKVSRGGRPAPEIANGEVAEAGAGGRLELRSVVFGYARKQPPVIRELDAVLEPGERMAVVGRTGSGKSTLAKLVAGLYEPWQGAILLDGRAPKDLSEEEWAASVAVVDQDLVAFEGTVRENLTLWDPEVPEERLIEAARDACILDEIRSRPGGFDSPMAEGGTNWSGGQLQRLEIARALVRNPRLLVLDEATSALDPEVEARVVERIRRRGCTCLMIAHRLSTVRDCDLILVLEDGVVQERGDHRQLVARQGLYLDLVQQEES